LNETYTIKLLTPEGGRGKGVVRFILTKKNKIKNLQKNKKIKKNKSSEINHPRQAKTIAAVYITKQRWNNLHL